jgi:hypothetical protein
MTDDSTYSGDPTESNIDWIRDKIGDVDDATYILTDAEIESEIADQSNLYIAAANCCYKAIPRLGEYDKMAALWEKRGDILMATAKRKAFAGVAATVGKVKDVATYPSRFEHGEEAGVTWDIDG